MTSLSALLMSLAMAIGLMGPVLAQPSSPEQNAASPSRNREGHEAARIVERVVQANDPELEFRNLSPRQRRLFQRGSTPHSLEREDSSFAADQGGDGEIVVATTGCWRASSRWVARNVYYQALYAYSGTTRTCWYQDTQRVWYGKFIDWAGETFLAGWRYHGTNRHENIFGAVTHKGIIQGHFTFYWGDTWMERRPCIQHVLQGRRDTSPTFDSYSDCLFR